MDLHAKDKTTLETSMFNARFGVIFRNWSEARKIQSYLKTLEASDEQMDRLKKFKSSDIFQTTHKEYVKQVETYWRSTPAQLETLNAYLCVNEEGRFVFKYQGTVSGGIVQGKDERAITTVRICHAIEAGLSLEKIAELTK